MREIGLDSDGDVEALELQSRTALAPTQRGKSQQYLTTEKSSDDSPSIDYI